jgi:hypothetical protein
MNHLDEPGRTFWGIGRLCLRQYARQCPNNAYQCIMVSYFRTDKVPCVNDDRPCLLDASDNVINLWVCICMFWEDRLGRIAR